MTSLDLLLAAPKQERNPYVAYSYSYPHKSAYGPLTPAVALEPLWHQECREALFLYVHIPFCEMRCGFCNLFARAHADQAHVDAYLGTLARQARAAADLLGKFTMARFAVGGGTPTFLSPQQLDRLFDMFEREFGIDPHRIPNSVETSPKTATPDRLSILHSRGVERVSLGVQSFDDADTHALGRPQACAEVHRALERLRDFPFLNIDLIYGHPQQSAASWLRSVRAALAYEPDEIFLYPLYIRPNTGLGRKDKLHRADTQHTRQHYRDARDLLEANGYEQMSMRCFRSSRYRGESGAVYCCQRDAMLGLGCGARSYTAQCHYSTQFAVAGDKVQAILDDWIDQPTIAFREATWGIRLTEDERRRRFLIQSLLHRTGLDSLAFRQLFGKAVEAVFPELLEWLAEGLVEPEADRWRLTRRGFEFSDYLGPSLYSAAGRAALERFVQP
jgi:oxygen-independent coproporphyrinogen-3 oxidase